MKPFIKCSACFDPAIVQLIFVPSFGRRTSRTSCSTWRKILPPQCFRSTVHQSTAKLRAATRRSRTWTWAPPFFLKLPGLWHVEVFSPEIIKSRFGVSLLISWGHNCWSLLYPWRSTRSIMPQLHRCENCQELLSYLQTLAPWVTWQGAEAW